MFVYFVNKRFITSRPLTRQKCLHVLPEQLWQRLLLTGSINACGMCTAGASSRGLTSVPNVCVCGVDYFFYLSNVMFFSFLCGSREKNVWMPCTHRRFDWVKSCLKYFFKDYYCRLCVQCSRFGKKIDNQKQNI